MANGFARPPRPQNRPVDPAQLTNDPSRVLGTATPSSSLSGTLSGMDMQLPPPVPAPGIPGAQIPPDYAAVLNSPAFDPSLEEVPGGGRQALDAILSTIGGLLQGNPAALVGGIMGTRQNVQDIQERNRQAKIKSHEEKLKFITEGLGQARKDRLQDAQAKLDEAKRQGDINEIRDAERQVALERTGVAIDRDRAEAEEALAKAALERSRAALEASEDPDRERAIDTHGTYSQNLLRFRSQLAAQLAAGAAEPTLTSVDPVTKREDVIRGVDAIREELTAGLQGVIGYSAAFADPKVLEGMQDAFDTLIEPILDKWTERAAQSRVTKARETMGKAKAGAAKFKRQSEKLTARPFSSYGRDEPLPRLLP